MELALTITFWVSGSLLVYTFLGYPAGIHLLSRFLIGKSSTAADGEDSAASGPGPTPCSVSVVLVVRNEEERIESRIENLLATSHPRELSEIIVVSDGSEDDSAARVRNLKARATRVIDHPSHRGKPACLNDGVAAATGDIIVFADARQRFTPSTIPELAAAFADPRVGAVSGELRIGESTTGVAAGVDLYWRLEKAIRLGESRIDSAIGCTGAVYAIRREAFEPIPDDTILDDVVIPMRIALRGMRVAFHPEALAFDPQRLDPEIERRRKRRTLAGNFQMLFRYPGWLLPWRNRLFIQLVSHKYLRLGAPLLMAAALSSSALLAAAGSSVFLLLAIAQGTFYLVATIGMAFPRSSWRCFSVPAAFVFLNFMTVLGFLDYFRRGANRGW